MKRTKHDASAIKDIARRLLNANNLVWAISRESEEERTKAELNKLHDELEQIALDLRRLEAQSKN